MVGVRQFFPPAQWIPRYQLPWLGHDFVAGVTLAAYAIPVSLAYATLAGLPPQFGVCAVQQRHDGRRISTATAWKQELMQGGWGVLGSSWFWGLVLIGITIAIHASGIVSITSFAAWSRLERRSKELEHRLRAPFTSTVIVAVALLLGTLHGLEAAVWAAAYIALGALHSPADALLYSVDSMTTRGASGIVLHPRWWMMGALEAADGMLLFGLSTAFLFAVMQRLWSVVERTD